MSPDEDRLTFESLLAARGRSATWTRRLLLAAFAFTCVALGTAAFAPRVAGQLYEALIAATQTVETPSLAP